MDWKPSDVDAALGRVARPSCILAGRTYTGRILSIEEFAPYNEEVSAITEGDPAEEDVAALVAVFRRYGHDIFSDLVPRKPLLTFASADDWRDRHDPTERLLAVAPVVMLQTFMSFLRAQQNAMTLATVETSEPESKENSTATRRRVGGSKTAKPKRRQGRRSRS